MAMPRSTKDPFDSVRDAFADLGTSEKAAFVLEATFSTIGQALAETGRRAASIVDDLDIDSWFTAPPRSYGTPEAPTAEPPPMPATPVDIETTATRKKPAPKKPPSKTAGKPKTSGKPPRRRPPSDDAS